MVTSAATEDLVVATHKYRSQLFASICNVIVVCQAGKVTEDLVENVILEVLVDQRGVQ